MSTEYDSYMIEQSRDAIQARAERLHAALTEKAKQDDGGEAEDRAKDLEMWIKDMEFSGDLDWSIVENAIDEFERELEVVS